MATFRIEQPLRLVSRAHDGRRLGGVCAGIGRARGIHPAWIRAGFVTAALIGGVGVLGYLACWLIIPAEGEEPGELSSGWLVALAKTCATCLALATLAVVAAAATLFGLGWIAVALAAAALVAVLGVWPRLGPAWALLPIAGVALPTVAVAAGGVQFATNTGHVTVAPRVLATGGVATFRAGLGTFLVDLRRTELPATGTLDVRVDGGVRRTIVALPQHRCVHLELTYSIHPFWGEMATVVAGHSPSQDVVVFGNYLSGRSGTRDLTSPAPGPVLKLHLTSAGGSLYLRDYPDNVYPDDVPNWPGYPVAPEPRPNVKGLSKRLARYELRSWQTRHAAEVREHQFVALNMPSPCATTTTTPVG
jgi:phage shock protein PspC (stress-responsive transcriptional regulator)